MCGIIGRISLKPSPEKTLVAMKELTYRGYDSHGILLKNNESSTIEKDKGELTREKINQLKNSTSYIEIGHTRWSTHGKVSKYNAHPLQDSTKSFHVVMNGIIENHENLRKELEEKNIYFKSETDAEVIPCLFELYYDGSLLTTVKKVLNRIEGEFSFLLQHENFLIGYKNTNPLIFGIDYNEIMISSDNPLLQNLSQKYSVLEDDEIIVCEKYNNKIIYNVYDKELNAISKPLIECKNSYENLEEVDTYYMEKEIYEQMNLSDMFTSYNKKQLSYLLEDINTSSSIILTAAGSSYHACLYIHYYLLNTFNINSQVILASELSNYTSSIRDNTIICISQSGETADLITPMKELSTHNKIFSITNTKDSTLDRLSQNSIYLECGREVAVASTKAFTYQLNIPHLMTYNNTPMNEKTFYKVITENKNVIDELVKFLKYSTNIYFIGRNENSPLALESALKVKEITYIHAEGFAGGELKHGSLALIEENTPVFVLGNDPSILSNAQEIKTRGGIIIGIGNENNTLYDYFLNTGDILPATFSIILVQILAMKLAVSRGYNPDKPRNLAKSVTVK